MSRLILLGTDEAPRWALTVYRPPDDWDRCTGFCCKAGHVLPTDAIDCGLAEVRRQELDALEKLLPGTCGYMALERLAS